MKTLIIAAHPNLGASVINKRWLEELHKYPDQCTIHVLSEHYPGGQIDAEREHRLVEAHGSLIFQVQFLFFAASLFVLYKTHVHKNNLS